VIYITCSIFLCIRECTQEEKNIVVADLTIDDYRIFHKLATTEYM